MSKRRNSGQITKDYPDEGRDSGPVELPQSADAQVMAARKIAKPRLRSRVAASSTSSGFSFGATTGGFTPTTATNDEGFSNGNGNGNGNGPDSGTSNPFGFFSKPQEKAPVQAPAAPTNSFAFLAKPAAPQPSASFSSTSSPSSPSEDNLKRRALNEIFSEAVASHLGADKAADLTGLLEKYLVYIKQIKPVENSAVQPNTTASGPSFSFKPTTPAPQFKAPSEPVAPAPVFPVPTPSAAPASTFSAPPASSSASSQPISVDSDSESDDAIEIKGPTFTLKELPKSKDVDFTFKPVASEPAKAQQSGFTFDASKAKNSDSVFKFKPLKPAETGLEAKQAPEVPEATEAPKPKEAPAPLFSFSKSTDSASSLPAFSFNKPESSTFAFGKPADASFSFGKPADKQNSSSNSDRPLFGSTSFTPQNQIQPPTEKPSGELKTGQSLFRAPAATGTEFKFGQAADSTHKPVDMSTAWSPEKGISFAGQSTPFTFGAPAPAPRFQAKADQDPEQAQEQEQEQGEDENTEGESLDRTGKGAGEEDETVEYEKRAKLFMVENGKPEVKGLGVLRLLKHNDTGKTRVVMRAEGSGRLLLNARLNSHLSYPAVAKGQVKLPIFSSASGPPDMYIVRVKTEEDGVELSKKLEENK